MVDLDQLIGIPFKLGGRGYEETDCYGICSLASRDYFNHPIPEYSLEQPDEADCHAVEETMLTGLDLSTRWKLLESGQQRDSDLILFHYAGYDCHVGIIVDAARGQFLHIRPGTNSAIERYTTQPWKNRVMGFYRYEA